MVVCLRDYQEALAFWSLWLSDWSCSFFLAILLRCLQLDYCFCYSRLSLRNVCVLLLISIALQLRFLSLHRAAVCYRAAVFNVVFTMRYCPFDITVAAATATCNDEKQPACLSTDFWPATCYPPMWCTCYAYTFAVCHLLPALTAMALPARTSLQWKQTRICAHFTFSPS